MAGRRNVCAWRAYCHRCGRHSEPKRSRLLRLSSISVNPGAIFIPCGDKARGVCGTPLAYNVFCSVGNEGWGGGEGIRGEARHLVTCNLVNFWHKNNRLVSSIQLLINIQQPKATGELYIILKVINNIRARFNSSCSYAFGVLDRTRFSNT